MCVPFLLGDNMDDKYMKIAYNEALKAYKKGDVPIGCIIVKDDKIISKAYNKKEKNNNAVEHAEIIAINKACKKLKTWHLEDCKLYTTMEPCMMCSGAIIQSRINYVCYSIENENFGSSKYLKKYNKKIKIINNVLSKESKQLIQQFFKEKRI